MWERILLRILPVNVYRQIRGDMTDIYIAAYRKLPIAQEKYSSLSNPQLRDLAREHAIAAKNYDPAEPVREVKSVADGIWKVFQTFFLALFVIGVLSGSGFLTILSQDVLRTLSAVNSILVSIILLAPTSLAIIGALLFILLRIIFSSTVIVQTLNQDLVYGPDEYTTRDRERLVGVALWNSSLNGGAGIKLLSVFSALWLLSFVPRWGPYSYIVALVTENIDAFEGVNGYRDATMRVYRRIRPRVDSNDERSSSE